MNKISLKIITPLSVSFEGMAEEVVLTSTSGVITILPGHIPLISTIKAGELVIKKDGVSTPFAVFKGVVHVKEVLAGTTEIVVLVDRSEKAVRRSHMLALKQLWKKREKTILILLDLKA